MNVTLNVTEEALIVSALAQYQKFTFEGIKEDWSNVRDVEDLLDRYKRIETLKVKLKEASKR